MEDMETLRKYSEQELQETLRERREALRQFRFSTAGSKPKNAREGRNLRKQIARILTILNERRNA